MSFTDKALYRTLIANLVHRRDLLRWGAAAAAGLAVPPVLAQTAPPAPEVFPGKEKLISRGSRPLNLETPAALLVQNAITPAGLLFVRCHANVPEVDAARYTLTVSGEVRQPLKLSLKDLKDARRFKPVTVEALLQCAGNGRSFFEPKTSGNQWERGAVGVGHWTGVPLSAILTEANLKPSGRFVVFDGDDVPFGTAADFQKSLPIEKALARGTLLAYELNGKPLPADNGYPLRLVVPGWSGTYWVKWLTAITVQEKPFDGFFMTKAYTVPAAPQPAGKEVPADQQVQITENNVKAIVALPAPGDQLKRGALTTIAGFAWSGGERTIRSVEVSLNGGTSWFQAELENRSQPYTWRMWRYNWLPVSPGPVQILVRATDSSGNLQPMEASWNPKGYMYNAWDRVALTVV
ncbi:sulfite oxidase [Gloeobacter kilaueensis]|uniref:Sulfite oxidase n=1 Tax=Gloeobacter kilaueensis (strain ATCC BAA-2537 / CCAP 1431/1 / ULC 316 / JS1) TaxID=1183438 RepID=U5QNG0_GLOK1|nr:sulfite oxidase [Gloeobacter kilaueensis]AGY60403.1 sulfite oxidase [Gloeobacter kilaueensis JS1]